MSEQEPSGEYLFLQFGDKKFECIPERTSIFIHGPAHRDYDHIFIVQDIEGNEPEDEAGYAFFREVVGNFDEFVGELRKRNYTFVEKEEVSNFDKEMYQAYFNRDPLPIVEELPRYELTDRLEELVQKFGRALTNMPTDLLYDEITTPTNRPYPERWID